MVMGRPLRADKASDVVVCVRFTPDEVQYIDDVREGQTRSAYIRQMIAVEAARS